MILCTVTSCPRKAYDREIQDIDQPLLLHRPKRRRMPIRKGRGSKVGASTDEEEVCV